MENKQQTNPVEAQTAPEMSPAGKLICVLIFGALVLLVLGGAYFFIQAVATAWAETFSRMPSMAPPLLSISISDISPLLQAPSVPTPDQLLAATVLNLTQIFGKVLLGVVGLAIAGLIILVIILTCTRPRDETKDKK